MLPPPANCFSRNCVLKSSSYLRCGLAVLSLCWCCSDEKPQDYKNSSWVNLWGVTNTGVGKTWNSLKQSLHWDKYASTWPLAGQNVQICQNIQRIGCMIPCCKLQCRITQPILRICWHICTCRIVGTWPHWYVTIIHHVQIGTGKSSTWPVKGDLGFEKSRKITWFSHPKVSSFLQSLFNFGAVTEPQSIFFWLRLCYKSGSVRRGWLYATSMDMARASGGGACSGSYWPCRLDTEWLMQDGTDFVITELFRGLSYKSLRFNHS